MLGTIWDFMFSWYGLTFYLGTMFGWAVASLLSVAD